MGRCGVCGKKVHPVLQHCEPCTIKAAQRMRKKKGFKPRVLGGRGRPKKCLDETGTYVTNEVALKMSKADFSLCNRVLAEANNVSENTVARYRKLYGSALQQSTEVGLRMARADYSLSDKELGFEMGVSHPSVAKYRKIYAPDTVKPPRRYIKKNNKLSLPTETTPKPKN